MLLVLFSTFALKPCPVWGSNSRPSDYETDALPTALRRHYIWCQIIVSTVQHLVPLKIEKYCTHGGTRTPNLRFRRPTPYPLGHAGTRGWNSNKNKCEEKFVRRPGIEPGSQEWESCMIPLHQRRSNNFPANFEAVADTILWEVNSVSPASSVGRAWDS